MDVTPEPWRGSYLNPQIDRRQGHQETPPSSMVVGPHQGLAIQAARTDSPAGPTTGLTWPRPAGPQLICRDKSPAVHIAQGHLCPVGWPRLRAHQGVSSALPGLTLHRGHLSMEVSPC